jgi:predicted DsbA family dithiol-disulfide isomerase
VENRENILISHAGEETQKAATARAFSVVQGPPLIVHCMLWHVGQVESQRLLLWATKQGKAEALMTEFNVRHFEKRESINKRQHLVAAAEAAGLDPQATEAFLATDELEAEVCSCRLPCGLEKRRVLG